MGKIVCKPTNDDCVGDMLVFSLFRTEDEKLIKVFDAGKILSIEDIVKIRSAGISSVLVHENNS